MKDAYVLRKLLYHRMIDDEVGTYVTDYVQCAVGLACAIFLLLCVWKTRQAIRLGVSDASHLNVTKTTYCTLVLFVSFSCLSICAGLAHQYLQTVEPYISWIESPTWLVVWRLGFFLSSGLVFAFLTLPIYVLEQEGILRLGLKGHYVHHALAALAALGVIVYNVWISFDPRDPWQSLVIFIAIFTCAIFDFLGALVAAVLVHCRGQGERLSRNGNPDNCYPRKEKSKLPSSQSLTIEEDDQTDDDAAPEDCCVRWDLIFRVLAPLFFVAAGLIWFLLSKAHCSDHHDPHGAGCPLPNYFNHNALLHSLHAFVLPLFLIAEYLAMRRRPVELSRSRASSGEESTL